MSLKNNKRSSNRTDLTIVGHIRRVQTVGGGQKQKDQVTFGFQVRGVCSEDDSEVKEKRNRWKQNVWDSSTETGG